MAVQAGHLRMGLSILNFKEKERPFCSLLGVSKGMFTVRTHKTRKAV